ncbi:MAG: NACHT domain-containing protein, partial [Candidatus Competibacteraceae bacterium]
MSQPTPTPLPRLWDDLSLRPYLGEIRRRHGIVEILALPSMRDLPPVRIETLFVPPLLAEIPISPDSDPKQWPQGQSLFVALEENPCLVVLGDPGSGKTTLANWLAWRLSAGLTTPLPQVLEDRAPLPCVLREMNADIFAAETTLPDLAERIARHLLGDKADAALLASLRERVTVGSYVLILDGVDEIPVSHRKTVAGWVRQATTQRACVLATSRRVGYEDGPVDREKIALRLDLPKGFSEKLGDLYLSGDKAEIEAETKTDEPAWAQRRYLMPFDPDRIATFAENWYRQRSGTEHEVREKTADLLAALNRSEVTQRLARTPNLLALMAIVHRERAHLPDGKALLYDEIANAYINTIDSQRKIEPGDALAPFGWKERKAWLARVGFKMQRRRSAETEKANRDAGVLAREADVLAWLTDAMRASGVAQPEQTAGVYLSWVARRSGLLLPRGEGCHAFVHLSFQEYFCACFLADRIVSPAFVKKSESSDGSVNRDLLRQWGGEPVWRETLVFLFELLSAERDADWMDDLADILFGSDADFGYYHAALAARALADRHVRLGQEWQERLVNRCTFWAELDRPIDNLVLAMLVEAGYAAIVEGPLEAIQHEARLRVLIANDSTITDVSPLAGLGALQGLRLDGTGVTDLSPLAGLSALQWLHLNGTGVTDLS